MISIFWLCYLIIVSHRQERLRACRQPPIANAAPIGRLLWGGLKQEACEVHMCSNGW
jgi:hypothetical protein